jgi:hypothetical protein
MYYRITSNQSLHKPEKCKPKKLLKGTVLTNEKRGGLKVRNADIFCAGLIL